MVEINLYLEALKKHVTVHKDIPTAVFNLGDKIYRNEYITVLNDMDWISCLGELSNNLCFYYVGSLIMNPKYIRGGQLPRSEEAERFFWIICSR